jgi:hypothetical protein
MSMRVPPLTVGFWLIGGCALIPATFQLMHSVSVLRAVAVASVGHTVAPPTAGQLATQIALIVLFLSQGVVVWLTWVRPSAVLGGLNFLRRAQRRINADAPYGADEHYGTSELLELRWLAEDRLARSQSRLLSWARRIGALAVLAFFAGGVMAPPVFGAGVMAEATTQVFRYLDVVLVLLGVVGVVQSWRTSTDVNARAFLDRTAPVPEESSVVTWTEGQRNGAEQTKDPS